MGILTISAKCSDMCFTSFIDSNGNITESNGYVPKNLGIDEWGDYVTLDIDMETGQIQGWEPVSDSEVIEAQKDV